MNGLPILILVGAAVVLGLITFLLPDDDADPDGDADHISSAARRNIVRHELTRGVDLPTWKTPKEGVANAHERF